MDFLSTTPDPPSKTYQCLAVITLGANATSRRGSFNDHEDGGPLTRILSGGRRKSLAEDRRMSQSEDNSLTRILSRRKSQADEDRRKSVHVEGEGPFYWRCRVGVTTDNLIVLPLANPPNPVLKSRPPPLSTLVPTRPGADEDRPHPPHPQSLGRRLSAAFIPPKMENGEAEVAHSARIAGLGRRLSAAFKPIEPETPVQTQPMPEISDDAVTSDTAEIPTESGFPGTIEGAPLSAIVIPLNRIKQGVKISERDGLYISVGVNSAVSGKSGVVRFEFERELGGKTEAEPLLRSLQAGISGPVSQSIQLGEGNKDNKALGAFFE
ncbi:hypothetical protein CcaverHIS002_0211000 [Cutaneotrichosporon cavernicola]|uniref:Uncharacterized protein n=1 Tax=Cutaneotrichosporon cavernicola TaxID=279322 RepID=A0AA48L2N6_9TREE|nr:uncharacterized protein CcaverHIS019_0211000 [Cutaneotrichosporon cavernicola]BEI81940.1 hypothetical protein CcaverHIS002_0211000 [Cutaneotrichosporon cavernicola]BEI89738.1 hypothetical protein CcaverHIS019_0211000 [Cutaneotrichosporon cavernicola]BEI97509.1 hypothetical protein CcaverHIS631_0210980 [Cutaneotrichosporon cavernicola]BEJ05287.1 hypothetical protein CcaverHIS641_0211040 [Cutaneotrichosporon cavernicola]